VKNPPAFPRKPLNKLEEEMECGGMTLRDYFAAKAMQACFGPGDIQDSKTKQSWGYDDRANVAYRQADAMLKAREQ